ncbi:MAG: serine/threonine protein kinase [Proteobacteria bacterium]|nr:serine/threonine protein kinase [Pseudomonadota bacterium]
MQVPFQLGRYKVVGQVGAGGFATVYRAKVEGDMGFSRDVALKVLHPHITSESPDVVAMLADEARLLSRMQHPNIVYVQWFGRMANPDGGELFGMTMEYVEGRSWRSVLQEAQRGSEGVPMSVILDVHTDIARGLEFAHGLTGDDGHSLGLVHRDLKPDNIMVSSRGVVKLLDFGIAKARDRLASATETDLVRGTVHYMSPEQVYGVKDLDFRSDLFSFGAMLFEAIVGTRMIEADTVIPAVREIADFDPTPPLGMVAAVRPELVPILEKLVAKERDDRFESTSELVEALVRARGVVEAKQPTTAWLAARAEPLGETQAVKTPADLRRSAQRDGRHQHRRDHRQGAGGAAGAPGRHRDPADGPRGAEAFGVRTAAGGRARADRDRARHARPQVVRVRAGRRGTDRRTGGGGADAPAGRTRGRPDDRGRRRRRPG